VLGSHSACGQLVLPQFAAKLIPTSFEAYPLGPVATVACGSPGTLK